MPLIGQPRQRVSRFRGAVAHGSTCFPIGSIFAMIANRRCAVGTARWLMKAFVLQHTRELPDGTDDVKLVGVYSSEQAGRAAIVALSALPGFCEHPAGFDLSAYEFDVTHWAEGFVTTGDYVF